VIWRGARTAPERDYALFDALLKSLNLSR